MSQHDFNIANQGFPATRADINSALQALASNSAGATEPGTTYAYQLWYEMGTNLFKMRNGDNDAWITLAEFDQTNDEWLIVSKTSLTGSAPLPSGTTAQRDASPSAGFIRFNTETTSFEGYDGSAWGDIGDNGFSAVGEDIIPDTDGTRDLGSSTKAWAEVHADKAILTDLSDGTNAVGTDQIVATSPRAACGVDQTGTQAILYSFNTSSITDAGTGQTSFSFTNSMASADYLWIKSLDADNAPSFLAIANEYLNLRTASGAQCDASSANSFVSRSDQHNVDCIAIGDLA